MKPTTSKLEDKWQAEADADTLSRAGEISGDKNRVKKALIAHQKKLALLQKTHARLQKVFGKHGDRGTAGQGGEEGEGGGDGGTEVGD